MGNSNISDLKRKGTGDQTVPFRFLRIPSISFCRRIANLLPGRRKSILQRSGWKVMLCVTSYMVT